jgi:hypothetical protein
MNLCELTQMNASQIGHDGIGFIKEITGGDTIYTKPLGQKGRKLNCVFMDTKLLPNTMMNCVEICGGVKMYYPKIRSRL